MARRNRIWSVGDVFVIPLSNGEFAGGQVIARESGVLNSASVALFDQKWKTPEGAARIDASEARAFSVLFVTRDLLDSGRWTTICSLPVQIPQGCFPYESCRTAGFVGAKVIGSGIVTQFVEAYFGLAPWDDWRDPDYLDKLLTSPERKPAKVLLKADIDP